MKDTGSTAAWAVCESLLPLAAFLGSGTDAGASLSSSLRFMAAACLREVQQEKVKAEPVITVDTARKKKIGVANTRRGFGGGAVGFGKLQLAK